MIPKCIHVIEKSFPKVRRRSLGWMCTDWSILVEYLKKIVCILCVKSTSVSVSTFRRVCEDTFHLSSEVFLKFQLNDLDWRLVILDVCLQQGDGRHDPKRILSWGWILSWKLFIAKSNPSLGTKFDLKCDPRKESLHQVQELVIPWW